jgi:PKD domain
MDDPERFPLLTGQLALAAPSPEGTFRAGGGIMKTLKYAVTTLLVCFTLSCASLDKDIPVTLLDPDVQRLTVTVNGATIQDPDGPFLWNWGDGTVEESHFPNSHSYREPGFYHVTVKVSRKGHSETAHLYLKIAE